MDFRQMQFTKTRGGLLRPRRGVYVPPSEGEFNEPEGLTPLAVIDATVDIVPGDGGVSTWMTPSSGIGKWQTAGWSAGAAKFHNYPTQYTPGTHFSYIWPDGLDDGEGGWPFVNIWSHSAYTSNRWKELYFRIEGFRLNGSPAPTVRSDFQAQCSLTKWWYIAYMSSARENQSTTGLRFSSPSPECNEAVAPNGQLVTVGRVAPLFSRPNDDGSDPGGEATEITANLASPTFTIGEEHTIEQHLIANTISPSMQDDGIFEQWVNGVKTHSYTDRRYRSPAHPRGFYLFHVSPVWGGNSGQVKNRNDWFFMRKIYLSGAGANL